MGDALERRDDEAPPPRGRGIPAIHDRPRGPGLKDLVVTGDDFGFSRGVNRAIAEAHDRGILTAASLMVTGSACGEAVAIARERPSLAVGLHLVLVCGKPASPPEAVGSLVSGDAFRESPVLAGLVYQFSRRARRELPGEIRAQLEAFRATGLPLSHVDGHLHLHLHPVVLAILGDLAAEFAIPAIRLPSEELRPALAFDRSSLPTKLVWAGIFRLLRRHGERRLARAGIAYADRVYGLFQTGRVTERYLLSLLPRIRGRRSEIYAHPALPEPGEPLNGPPGAGPRELAALLSPRVRDAMEAHGLRPATSADFRPAAALTP
ncbi:MAG TPA: hopanoid biosynthesis-associated protein HpnK [Thermoanaerobaculia bacterium]|nr:hopanoid biosynthesis-associated protein HpnK [Thermoanaerobaculia bacterium]